MPLILLSNDDGVAANGLNVLAGELAQIADIVVVAPDRERSASGHAFTMHRPLRCEELRPNWFRVDGTPADCVYLGVLKICPRKPDLVISGINHGYNLGSDLFYSGTVAGAVEGALRDVPSIAISAEWSKTMTANADYFLPAAKFARSLADAIMTNGLPSGTLLNVNVPAQKKDPLTYQWAKLGQRVYRDQVDEREDIRGRRYYWIGGPAEGFGDVPGSDCDVISRGVVSVTPIDLDLTHSGVLAQLPGWSLPGFEAVLAHELETSNRESTA